MSALRRLFLITASLSLASGVASAQFQLVVQQENNFFEVGNGAALGLAAKALRTPFATRVTVTYRGATSATVTQLPQLLGSPDFRVTAEAPGGGPLSLGNTTLNPNQSLILAITYLASTSDRASASLQMLFSERVAVPEGQPQVPPRSTGVSLTLVGTAPEFVFSYVLATDSNVTPLPSGGVVPIPDTVVNGLGTAVVLITNRGTAAGTVDSIAVSGEIFQLQGVPLLPVTVNGGQSVQLSVRYRPRLLGTDSAVLEIKFGSETFRATLRGTAIRSLLAYEILRDEEAQPFFPNERLALPDTDVDETVRLTLRVRNVSQLDLSISSLNVSGPGYALADLPLLPLVLAPNESQTFTLTFRPLEPGVANGRLRIGADTFELTGKGIAPRLIYSYRIPGGRAVTVALGGQVIFSPLIVGQARTLEFSVQNTGTAPAFLASIGIVDGRTVFSLADLPVFPAAVDPEATVTFTLRFAPQVAGLATAQLRIDAAGFTLSGFGDPPPPLPEYTFSSTGGTLQPLTQPGVSLTLAQPYPLPITGTLTMTIETDAFVPDPAVQFSTGGRQVAFTIPANSTRAVFANGSNEIKFQSGTVASSLLLTPAFTTQGGAALTPDAPRTLRFTVPAAAPRLLSVQALSRSTAGFILQVTGFTTTRSLSNLNVQFTPAAGQNLTGTALNVNVGAVAESWFRSAASQSFGGQFTIDLPITISQPPGLEPLPLSSILQSAAATIANEIGASNSLSVSLQ